jgi:hypothetical protein
VTCEPRTVSTNHDSEGYEVLTATEEGALSRLRELIGDIRARDPLAGPGRMERAMVDAGAEPGPGAGGTGSREFMFHGAHLVMGASDIQEGRVEIRFLREAR